MGTSAAGPSWDEVTAAVARALSGDRTGGRRDLLDLWDRTAPARAAQRCVLAHYLADLEDDLAAEVAWDERALAAYPDVGETELAAIGIPSAAGLAPSLHLNLGDGYRRQGRADDARQQLDRGVLAVHALSDDGYASMIRGGLERLAERLAQ